MAFVTQVYEDGEWAYDTPQWRSNIEQLIEDAKPISFRSDNKQFNTQEVGLKHPENGSYIRICDSGAIEAFTSYGTGIRINHDNTIQIFADKIQQISKEFDVHTTANNKINNNEYKTYPKDKGMSLDTIRRLEETGLEVYGSKEWKTP